MGRGEKEEEEGERQKQEGEQAREGGEGQTYNSKACPFPTPKWGPPQVVLQWEGSSRTLGLSHRRFPPNSH